MDSKSGVPSDNSNANDLPPPSYNDSLSTTSSSQTHPLNPFTTQISSQLQHLTTAITTTRAQATLLSSIHDQQILSYLTPHIQTYLSDFSHTGLTRGSLILVPANDLREVDEKALPTDYDFKDPECFDRIVRVKGVGKGNDVEDGKWFWRDEEMATRIAENLRPAPDPKTAELPPRKEELQPRRESKSFWGRKKNSKVVEAPIVREAENSEKGARGGMENRDKVIMDVKAEEIVFRTENAFGILGTEKGWGIVVTMKVHLAGN